jgi:hypothetical protein
VNYQRVMPRDLFNEADLLKCYGRLWILTERYKQVELDLIGEYFRIEQDDSDGSLSIFNVTCTINGEPQLLYRPLNSTDTLPLMLMLGDTPINVFTDNQLSDLMLDFIGITK